VEAAFFLTAFFPLPAALPLVERVIGHSVPSDILPDLFGTPIGQGDLPRSLYQSQFEFEAVALCVDPVRAEEF
jgi:hypothetical protein